MADKKMFQAPFGSLTVREKEKDKYWNVPADTKEQERLQERKRRQLEMWEASKKK